MWIIRKWDFCGGDEGQLSLPGNVSSLYLTPYTKPVSNSVYLEKAKRKNDEIVQINS